MGNGICASSFLKIRIPHCVMQRESGCISPSHHRPRDTPDLAVSPEHQRTVGDGFGAYTYPPSPHSMPVNKSACEVHSARRPLWCMPSSGNVILRAPFSLPTGKIKCTGSRECISCDEYQKGTLCRRKKACAFKNCSRATFAERLKRPRYETTGNSPRYAHSSGRLRRTDEFG